MMHRRLSLLPFLLVLLGSACASSGGSALYRREIGNVSGPDAMALTEQVLGRYAFQIEQRDTEPDIRILTQWKARQPLADEAVLGVTAAENRILVVGRLRGQTELGGYYNLTMTVENRLQVAGSPDWNETLNTPQFREYADVITKDFQQLVTNIGVRRY